MGNRKQLVQNYIDKSNRILLKANSIEDQLERSKRNFSLQLKKQEERLREKIYDTRKKRLSLSKKEIESKNFAHKLFLDNMKETLDKNLEKYSTDIRETIN